jgi:WD40 repeat protein
MQILKGHRRPVQSVAFSPDGKQLASGSGDRTIRLWDLATGTTRQTWKGHDVMRNKVAFSPDGRWLAAIHNHQIRVYDLRSGEEAQVLGENVPSGSAEALTFSPDGKRLVAGGVGGRWNRWRVWMTAPWREKPAPEFARRIKYVCNLAFAPDGDTLAVIGYSEV